MYLTMFPSTITLVGLYKSQCYAALLCDRAIFNFCLPPTSCFAHFLLFNLRLEWTKLCQMWRLRL